MTKVKESDIERRTVLYVTLELGLCAIKLGQEGWPDRLIPLPNGRSLFIEFKRTGKLKLEKLQQIRKTSLESLGHDVIVCNDVDEAKRRIHEALDTA